MANFDLNSMTQLLGAGTSLFGGLQSTNRLFSASDQASAAGGFNAQVELYNSTKRINHLARQVRRVLGTQGVQAAGTGFRSTSKSFLMVKAAGLAELERRIVEEKSASDLQQKVLRFQAERRAAAIRSSARTQRTNTFAQLGKNLEGLEGLLG
jgi:hypothetical protein